MQSPDFTNPRSWSWNATLDRELPWAMRETLPALWMLVSLWFRPEVRGLHHLPDGLEILGPQERLDAAGARPVAWARRDRD